MNEEILKEIAETTKDMLEAIGQFTPEQFNLVPFEGSWTAGQVAEHIYKSERNMAKVWQGNTVPTERAPDAHVGMIKDIFLNYSTKLKSPDFILPTDETHDKDELYNALKDNRGEIMKVAAVTDLTQTFTDFAFPSVGPLTGIEGAMFIICHSKRHTWQLKNIYERVKGQ